MNDQSRRNRVRETAKLLVRRGLQRADIDISRGSYANRLTRTLDSRGLDTILDIGANVGQYASLARSAGYSGRIISCEPLSGAHDQLSRRAKNDSAWVIEHTAVGAEPSETTINIAENSFSSSILDMTDIHLDAAPGSGYIGVETVSVTTVEELVKRHAVDPAHTLLKIDTQGFEAEVLEGAGPLVGKFGAIQLELSFVELYSGQRLFDDLVGQLKAAGYRLQQLEPGFSDAEGRLLQVDGLFVLT